MTPKALRSLRINLGLPVGDFATRMGVSEEELQQMELGGHPIDVARVSVALEQLLPSEAAAVRAQ
ncbi:MAG: hypothetical protein ACXVH7_10225, partial [Thermoanaerobaculia bacterium]